MYTSILYCGEYIVSVNEWGDCISGPVVNDSIAMLSVGGRGSSYLHSESSCLLVVVVEDVGHEGGVVGQALAHAQGDGLAGEHAVAASCCIHWDGHTSGQHGHRQHPPQAHGPWEWRG